MDSERAPYEVARVLRPGGRFGLLWNGRDRQVRWVADLEEIVRAGTVTDEEKETGESNLRDGSDDATPQDRRPRAERVRMPDDAPFGDTATHVVRWSRPITPEDVVGLIGTYSRIIVLPEAQRQALLERVADFTRTDPALAGRDMVDLPMTCRCWRATRA
jgi:SAM-dependent methyltransferase